MDSTQVTDGIERQITINASIERIWALVSVPGWWIGDGDPSRSVVTQSGDLTIVEYAPYGKFPVLPVATQPPHYVAFRGGDDPDQRPTEGNATLVEFFLTESDDQTVLRVLETGFTKLFPEVAQRTAAVADNIAGWEMQLGFAKRDAEQLGG